MDAFGYWTLFGGMAAVIALAGPHLSRNGDIIAEKTGLSGNWVGMVMIATVTSLPEMVTGGSAILYWDLPDLAVGDLLGSCVFNLMILLVIDFMLRGAPVYSRANVGHIISAGYGSAMLGFVALSLVLAGGGIVLPVGWVGFSSFILIALYVLAIRIVYLYDREHHQDYTEDVVRSNPGVTLAMALRRYALAAILIVCAGIVLPYAGAGVAATMGWNKTFVGTLLIAAATSMPELAVTIAAVRIGALNMAVAGLLGSNMFNILLLAFQDIAYSKGPILAAVSQTHVISAISALIMTGLFTAGLQFRPGSKPLGAVGWISIALFILYLYNSYILFLYGH